MHTDPPAAAADGDRESGLRFSRQHPPRSVWLNKALKTRRRGFDDSSSPSASLPSRDILFLLLISARNAAGHGHSRLSVRTTGGGRQAISGRYPSLSAHFLRGNRTTGILVRILEARQFNVLEGARRRAGLKSLRSGEVNLDRTLAAPWSGPLGPDSSQAAGLTVDRGCCSSKSVGLR